MLIGFAEFVHRSWTEFDCEFENEVISIAFPMSSFTLLEHYIAEICL